MFEEEINNNLSVESVAMNTNGSLSPPDDPLPSPLNTFKSGFNLAIVGSSNSGKTTLLINLLSKPHKKIGDEKVRQSFKKLFTNIFIVSPSTSTLKNNVFEDLPDDQKSKVLTEEFIDDLYEKLDTIKEEADEDNETYYSLLILDDVATQLRKNKRLEQKLVQLGQNRRHLGSGGLSIITLVQSHFSLPPQLRNNLTHYITFKPKTPKERNSIMEDIINLDKKHTIPLFDFIYRGKHDFLLIDFSLSKDTADYEYYRNYNKINFLEK